MKTKKTILLVSSFIFLQAAGAQVLDKASITEIQTSFKRDSYTKAMQNALSHNSIYDLTKNLSNAGEDDHHFTYRVNVKGITNQKKSGRCWLFTALNMFRPRAMAVFNLNAFEFSQNHLYFWDLFEKSNLFLNNMIETAELPIDDRLVQWYFRAPVSDGGTWSNFANLADKYGMMPKEVMQETYASENTKDMRLFINLKLRENGLRLRRAAGEGKKPETLQEMRKEMMKEIYRMLALNLGEPPSIFSWRCKSKDGELSDYHDYTPLEFKGKILGDIKMSDYVMLMNDPTRPFNVHYEVENYRNVEEGQNWHYVNLSNETIKTMAVQSLKNNEAMYASCDVRQQLDPTHGILDLDNFDYESALGVNFGMNKTERIQSRASASSHGMALIAVDLDANNKPVKWQFENSWGTALGHKGYLTFTDEWFDEFMFRIVIHKAFVSPEILEIYERSPTVLPPWDWMF